MIFAGGWIDFVQDPYYLECEQCEEGLHNVPFLGLCESGDVPFSFADQGEGHASLCGKCGTPAFQWASL